MNLIMMGYDIANRKDEILKWYSENDWNLKRNFLVNNGIKYIYWVKNEGSPLDLGRLGLSNIFENDSVIVYKVN
ncbi:MAG: hypothetical protein GYA62_16435 [Bacteroidales bacterium]|nr:hypothetical protein [Bacteroidales bacterium]